MTNFKSLESLRAYMAWWVVIGHALHLMRATDAPFLAWLPPGLLQLLMSGDVAVSVFIVVSGFVITHLLLGKNEPYPAYLLRRSLRLYPIYLFCLLAAILIQPLYQVAYVDSLFPLGREMRLERLAQEADHWGAHLLLHLTLLHGVVPDAWLPFAGTTFLSPAWSLSLEWQFYLIAPLLLWLMTRQLTVVVATVAVLALLRAALLRQDALAWSYNAFFFVASSYFLIGILSRLALERLARRQWPWGLLLLTALLLLTVSRLSALIWVAWFGIVLLEAGVLKPGAGALRRLLHPLAFGDRTAALGRWSYSTYLVHIPVFSLLVGGYGLWVGGPNMRQDHIALILLASFPLIAGLSALLYRYIELPPMQWGRQWLKRAAGDAAGRRPETGPA